MDSCVFLSIPSVNKSLVLELARCEFVQRHENVLLGNFGTCKTHLALGLGLAASQRAIACASRQPPRWRTS